jgi:hypothetical protein
VSRGKASRTSRVRSSAMSAARVTAPLVIAG